MCITHNLKPTRVKVCDKMKRFVDTVQAFPFLYDKSHSGFRDMNAKVNCRDIPPPRLQSARLAREGLVAPAGVNPRGHTVSLSFACGSVAIVAKASTMLLDVVSESSSPLILCEGTKHVMFR